MRLPAEGLPMRQALLVLIPKGHEWREQLDQFLEGEGGLSEADIRPLKQGVFSILVRLEQDERIYLTGVRPGASHAERIAKGLLASSRHQDFRRQTLETRIGTFSGVMVRPVPVQQGAANARAKGGSPYAESDNRIALEIMSMMAEEEAKNVPNDKRKSPWGWATKLARRAEGSGSLLAKAKRLREALKRLTQTTQY